MGCAQGANQSTHVGFTTSCLSVRKAGGHPPLKDGLHQRLSSEPGEVGGGPFSTVHLQQSRANSRDSPVNHLVGGVLVEGVVESEGLVLQVAGQVHLLLGLVHHHHVLAGDGDHVQVLHRQLCGGRRRTPTVTGWMSARRSSCPVTCAMNEITVGFSYALSEFVSIKVGRQIDR